MTGTTGDVSLSSYNTRYNRAGVKYPSPFFDLSQVYLPSNMRAMFRWCRYYAMTYGPTYAFVTKMSSYALTELVWGSSQVVDQVEQRVQENLKKRWKDLLVNKLRIYEKYYVGGLHYWTYGNWYMSVEFPFDRYLKCPHCKKEKLARKFPTRKQGGYVWRDYKFTGICPYCDQQTTFIVRDVLIRSPRGIRVKLWNPEQVIPVGNEATDRVTYYYQPDEILLREIRRGDRETIETTPWPFIKAAKKKGLVKFRQGSLLHIKAPSPDGRQQFLGHSPMTAALKDIFHVQLMKRAQEANCVERTIPLSMVHPMPISGDSNMNPYYSANIQDLIDHTKEEIAQARSDPNYIPVVPLPLGVTPIWGDGKNLLLIPEIRGWTELIAADLAVPVEFLFGGLTFSGSNVSLRMLENQILSFRTGYVQATDFIVSAIGRFLQWPTIPHRWTPFKMADDIQLKQHMIMLSQMNKISDETLLSHFDRSAAEERDGIMQAVKHMTDIQSQQMEAQMKIQNDAAMQQQAMQQQMMGGATVPGAQPGGMPQEGMPAEEMPMEETPQEGIPQEGIEEVPPEAGGEEQSLEEFAQQVAQELAPQPPEIISRVLDQVAAQNPELAQYIAQLIGQYQEQMQAPQEQMQPQQTAYGPPQSQPPMPQPGMPQGMQMLPGQAQQQQAMMQPMPEQRAPRRGPGSSSM